MNAQEYLQRAESAGRVKWLAQYEGKECIGRAGALILDEKECIAVLLEDGSSANETRLRAGQVVKYVFSPEYGGPIVIGATNLRGDKPQEEGSAAAPAEPPPPATPSTPPAEELKAVQKKPRGRPRKGKS